MIEHIYVLNVPRETKRKEYMKKILKEENLKENKDFTILNGVDGRNISKKEAQNINKKRLEYYNKNNLKAKPLTRGQIGCIKSHLLAYEDMIKNNYDNCLILEDDSKFLKSYEYITKSIESFKEKTEYDYILLHRKCPNLCIKAKGWPFVKNWFITPNNDEENSKDKEIIKAGLSYGTNSQIVSLKGACKLLKWCEIIYDPMDIQIHMMNNNTNVFNKCNEELKMYATTESYMCPVGFASLTQRIR